MNFFDGFWFWLGRIFAELAVVVGVIAVVLAAVFLIAAVSVAHGKFKAWRKSMATPTNPKD